MQNLYNLPIGNEAPEIVNAIIEVPQGSSNKYEYDPEFGIFRLDRVLYSPLHYPGGYGFLPQTLAEDGDPIDILVLTTIPTYPGTVMEVYPLGFLEMSDEKGRDQKVLAVPTQDPRYDNQRTLSQVSPHILREIEHFFDIYKELEGKNVTVETWYGIAETHKMIREGLRAFTAASQAANQVEEISNDFADAVGAA
jgi:inorganic pyrophosphatase